MGTAYYFVTKRDDLDVNNMIDADQKLRAAFGGEYVRLYKEWASCPVTGVEKAVGNILYGLCDSHGWLIEDIASWLNGQGF